MARIFVVDSDQALVTLISAVLLLDNHDVLGCTKAVDAFSKAAEFEPEILITSTWLKSVSGIQLTKHLRTQGVHFLVLYLSHNSGLTDSMRQVFGEAGVLQKPFTASELRSSVKRLLSHPHGRGARQSNSRDPKATDEDCAWIEISSQLVLRDLRRQTTGSSEGGKKD